MRIATVIVFVHDVRRMRAFYEGILGLPVIEAAEGWVRLEAGGTTLALHATPAAGAVASPPAAREDSWLKVAFHADDVAAVREQLVRAGVRMREVRTFGSIALCDGLDPEGNVFQISSRPPASPPTKSGAPHGRTS